MRNLLHHNGHTQIFVVGIYSIKGAQCIMGKHNAWWVAITCALYHCLWFQWHWIGAKLYLQYGGIKRNPLLWSNGPDLSMARSKSSPNLLNLIAFGSVSSNFWTSKSRTMIRCNFCLEPAYFEKKKWPSCWRVNELRPSDTYVCQ